MRQATAIAFAVHVARYEGREGGMYRDTHANGYVTTGVGNLIDPMSLALAEPWLRPDEEPATEEEIRAEWRRVKAMPPGLHASRYRDPNGLHLSDEAVDALRDRKRDEFWTILSRRFDDIEEWPAPAQLGLLLMAWALGPWFPKGWPRFSAACQAQDWAAAAGECRIHGARDVRNDAHRDLFLAAADATDPEALKV